MNTDGKQLFDLMKEMTQDLTKAMGPLKRPYAASLAKLEREYEEADTFDHLVNALADISDAWYSVHQSLKKSVYYEEDEDDVEKMRDQLQKMEKQLTKMLERRGIL